MPETKDIRALQGMDYAYTLQGWLKGINSDALIPKTDMGHDGLAGTANALVGRDAFGESIGYHGDGDYKAIDATRWGGSFERPFAAVGTTGTLALAHKPLYNGNIAHTVNSLQPWGGWTSPTQPAQVLAQVYRYDQLNRLKQAQGVEGLTVAANSWDGVTDAVADRYKSAYTYDANGNIGTAERFDETGTQYDNLEYHYEKNGAQLLRNRLYHLNETIDGSYGDIGIDASTFHAPHADVNALNNYKYDELGNLIADKREEIANIEWTVSGKVKRITRTPGSTKPPLEFAYGADGQRISKTVGDPLNGGYREWYVRDAQGNIMAVYKYADNGASLKVTERPVYGSSRLGSYTRQMELVGEQTITNYPYTQPMQAPLKRYELTDHLGNVNTVVTGRLLPGNGAGSAKQAEVVSATGYESFGFALPNRSFQSSNYGWGFGNHLKDNEIYGDGNSYDMGARLYDPRVVRTPTLDPLAAKYAGLTPYGVLGGNPILYVDPNGKENVIYLVYLPSKDNSLTVAEASGIVTKANEAFGRMGLCTAVVLVDMSKGKNSGFNPLALDKTDGVAVIGTRRDVIGYISKYDSKEAGELSATWSGEKTNPEQSQNNKGAGRWIAIDANGIAGFASEALNGSDKLETGGLIINHGAGHNAGANHGDEAPIKGNPGNTNSVIMYSANGMHRILGDTEGGSYPAIKDITNNDPAPVTGEPRNADYVKRMESRFGKNVSHATYQPK